MPTMDFFPQRPQVSPKIYAYELIGVASHRGYIKVGYTERDVDTRIREQTHTVAVPYRVLETWTAMRSDGSCFTDKDLHAVLRRKGFRQLNEGEDRNEWFRCTVNDVKAAVYAVRNRTENIENRTNDFSMRPEQKEAVDKTEAYFRSAAAEGYPKFLWNCKMRFGKTFAAYQLAKRMGFKRVLVLTFKPAVVSAWQEDLNTHKDFEGWQFISRTTELTYETADQSRPIVCFGSFQDYLGVDKTTGTIKGRNEWVHTINWDLVIFDEYHFGAFRVQSPWEVTTDKGQKEIIKKECYVFDFALNRALRQISDYSCRLNIHEGNPEKKVAEFINFLPVIAYDGSSMRQINAGDILDIAMAGTSATLLAKRWESVLLVNVDNETLSRLIANKDAMDALMKIEGFRSLNSDIETIIAKSEKVKKAKKEGTKDLTPKQKKELSDEEKEYKSKRKQIQEKLIKFATRIPVFMYLTDYRERCLKDVITQLEPGLFKKVTGLSVKDFELLVSLGVFNDSLMNDAVYKFKRYEDASLSYTGINRHEGEDRGGWDTVLSDADYNKMFTLQQASMEAPAPAPDDLPTKPYFTPDEDEPKPAPEKKPAPQPTKPIISYGGFTPKTNTAQYTQASGSKIHKPSNSYTPRPASSIPGSFTPRPAGSSVGIGVAKPSFGLNSQPAAQPKPPVKVDISKIKVGVKVKHKAFGVGTVAAIQPDMVTVRFGNVEKKFLLPAAIVQGYLSLMEN